MASSYHCRPLSPQACICHQGQEYERGLMHERLPTAGTLIEEP